jgi:hypothetical protein
MPANLNRSQCSPEDDQTRSWSTRIANAPDPFAQRPATRTNKPVIGPPVEERRTDGDRSTRVLSATEWLKAKDASNNLRRAPRASGPPQLPRHSSRDHLSDVNRANLLFDPARPEMSGQVRVTTRTTFDDCSADGRRRAVAVERAASVERARRLEAQAAMEAERAAEANELLELRSMGIRSVLARDTPKVNAGFSAARSPVQTRARSRALANNDTRGAPSPPSPPSTPPPQAAVEQAPPPPDAWQAARRSYAHRQLMVDGTPLDLDLSWIAAPLVRAAEGTPPSPYPAHIPPLLPLLSLGHGPSPAACTQGCAPQHLQRSGTTGHCQLPTPFILSQHRRTSALSPSRCPPQRRRPRRGEQRRSERLVDSDRSHLVGLAPLPLPTGG